MKDTKPLLDRILAAALMLLAAAWALSTAWRLLHPLLPVAAGGLALGLVVVAVRMVLRGRDYG